jgi:DNA-binding MarR family transcriptional regulator
MSTNATGPLSHRMGYLLKHAREALTALTAPALAPYGIDGRSLAVLLVLDAATPLSQQQAATRLGVDRTTMVALIDALEHKALVVRTPHPSDRRKNVVALTASGRDTLIRASAASEEAEQRFLAPLTGAEAARLRATLQKLI